MEWAYVGIAESNMLVLVHTLFSWGYLPVSIDIRDGTQIGEAQYALLKVTPLAARASRLGV